MSNLLLNSMDKGITLSVLGYWGANADGLLQKATNAAGCVSQTIDGCVAGIGNAISSMGGAGSTLAGFGPPQLTHISMVEPSAIWIDPSVATAAANGDMSSALIGTVAALTAGTIFRGAAKNKA